MVAGSVGSWAAVTFFSLPLASQKLYGLWQSVPLPDGENTLML